MWAGPGRGAQAGSGGIFSTGQVGLKATLPRTDDPGGGVVDTVVVGRGTLVVTGADVGGLDGGWVGVTATPVPVTPVP